MDKIKIVLIVLGCGTREACAVVRTHAVSGEVAADSGVEIFDVVVESTPNFLPSIVRRVKVDAGGNIKNFPNHAVIRVAPRLSGRRRYTNISALNTRAHHVLETGANVSDFNAPIRTMPEKREPSLSFSRAAQQRSPDASGSRSEFVRKVPSSHEKHQWSIAVYRTRIQNPLTMLLFLTTIFVSAGLVVAVLFPAERRRIVDQVVLVRRGLIQRNAHSHPGWRKPKSVAENDFFKDFEIGEKLGEGAFGVVHLVISRQEKANFAAKMIDVMESDVVLIKEEVAILKRVQHASLTACCLREYHDQCFYYLVMPIYDGGDLSGAVSDYIETQGLLSEPLFARLFEQMTKGVAFVQSKQVVHRDIKPENFLLASSNLSDPKNLVVVADFGMSAVLDDGGFLDEICGTPIFMSPELFAGKYGFKVDVFALGLSAYVLLTGAFAFHTEKEIKAWAASSESPPMPPSISQDTQEIVEKTLARDAAQRVSAAELEKLASRLRLRSFNDVSVSRKHTIEPPPRKAKGYRTMGISGGEIQENKAERRHRMLWELVRDRHGKTMADHAGGALVSAAVFAGRPFELKKGRRNRKVSRYEFWSHEDCLKLHVSGSGDTVMEPLAQVNEVQPSDMLLLDDVLERYNVDRGKWGQGNTKSLSDLAHECRGGVCFLTENEKRLERVVEVVALIVINSEGKILHQFPLVPKVALGKASQRRSTMHTSFTEPRLPAKKRMAWETVREATERVLNTLNMQPEDVSINFDIPMRVVKEISTSYPGLTTVYKKHMVEALIREEGCSSDKLALWGLPGSNRFVVKSSQGASNWGWISQAEAERLGALHEGDEGLGMRYAEVLPIKTKVISGDEIKVMLRKTNAKVEDMCYDALEELAEQARTGEVELVEEEELDGSRNLKRKVTVTMLRLAHQEGNILLEVSKSTDGGATWKNTNWLPATKQHTFENPYYVARRLLTSRFMVAEGRWTIDKDKGGCITEEHESDKLLGLPTIYKKHIVAARLC